MTPLTNVDLVLGSTSPYRRELLARLTSRFRTLAPQVDETPMPGEAAAAIALRLAEIKAREVAARAHGALVIGSDQVAELDQRILGKPGNALNARAQLAACSGRVVAFHTAICLLDARVTSTHARTAIDTTRVVFRRLDADEIARYVECEQPLDCAGSFKSEGLGIALFEHVECVDPTALIGLPLIALCRLLREAGVAVV
jgi:septum formation protein